MSAPFSKSREQMSLDPFEAARCNAVRQFYNNRERDREIGQVRDTQSRMGMVQGQEGRVRCGRSGPVRKG